MKAHIWLTMMEKGLPRNNSLGELGPRDVARAILMERERTRLPVYLDLRHLGRPLSASVSHRLPPLPGMGSGYYLGAYSGFTGGATLDRRNRDGPGRANGCKKSFAVGEVASTGARRQPPGQQPSEGLVWRRVACAAAAIRTIDQAAAGSRLKNILRRRSETAAGNDSACRAVRPLLQSCSGKKWAAPQFFRA